MSKIFARMAALVLAATVWAGAAQAGGAPGRLSFDILMNGALVGAHSVTVEHAGEDTLVKVAIDMKGKVGPFNFFYSHACTERWRAEQLQALNCRDRENNTINEVRAERGAAGLTVFRNGAQIATGVDAVPTSWWRKRTVAQTQLLDTRDGKLMRVRTGKVGDSKITVGGATLTAGHHKLRATTTTDIWYDSAGRWVKMKFKLSGQNFEYRLTTPIASAPIG
jgi:hypothetical protein